MSTILRKAVTRIILDVASPDVQKAVSVTQGDVNRKFEITLVDGGRPFPLQPKWTAALVGIKPDGKNLFNSCVVDETGKIVYDFAGGEEIATAAGGYAIYFEIYDEVGDTLASPSIWLTVIPFPSRDMASEDQYTAAREIIRRLNEAEGHIETLEGRLDEKDEQVEAIVDRLDEKDEQVEAIVGRLDGKDKQVEDIEGRLDEKDEQVEELQTKMTRVSLVTIPKSTWKDSTPIEAQIKLPDVVGNSVAFLVPADDTTRMTASAAGLTPTLSTLDKEGDIIFVSRGEFVPAHDMNFLCFVLQGESEEETEPTASFVGISAGGSGGSTPIANDLETNSPTWALSAAQGVVLKGLVQTAKEKIESKFQEGGTLQIKDGGTGASNVADVLENLGLSELMESYNKFETGTYTGTGAKTNEITFSFKPKIVIIYALTNFFNVSSQAKQKNTLGLFFIGAGGYLYFESALSDYDSSSKNSWGYNMTTVRHYFGATSVYSFDEETNTLKLTTSTAGYGNGLEIFNQNPRSSFDYTYIAVG